MNNNEMNTKSVLMCDVKLDDKRFQVRTELNKARIEEYATVIGRPACKLNAFATRPVLWWVESLKGYVVCDGFHRILAGKKQGVTDFEADVIYGSEQDALIEAMKGNLRHGIELTSSEREKAIAKTVTALINKDGLQPSHEIVSENLGIASSSVRSARKRLHDRKELEMTEMFYGKDGRAQPSQRPPQANESAESSVIAEPRPPAPTPEAPAKQNDSIQGEAPEPPEEDIPATSPPKSRQKKPMKADEPSTPEPEKPKEDHWDSILLGLLADLEHHLADLQNGWDEIKSKEVIAGRIAAVLEAGEKALATFRSQVAAA